MGAFFILAETKGFPRLRLRGNRDGATALRLSCLLVFEPLGSHNTMAAKN